MEVPWIGAELELQLPAKATPRQHQIPNPLSEARDQTHILMDTSQIHFHRDNTGTLHVTIFLLDTCHHLK